MVLPLGVAFVLQALTMRRGRVSVKVQGDFSPMCLCGGRMVEPRREAAVELISLRKS